MKGEFKMTQTVYRELLEVMKSRGGPYAGLDIPEFFALVEELFDPEEAEINNALPRKPAPVEEIAAKTGRSPEEVSKILERMAGKGIVWGFQDLRWRALPWIAFHAGYLRVHLSSAAGKPNGKRRSPA
jgi:hypothetical protein